ncbi:MAG TPA: VTT domain-containing protein [Flavisolibacter sp.]|nr:VTT domain-containing protein [Flavisolibacter sp.]
MDWLSQTSDLLLFIGDNVHELIARYGHMVYAIMFLIIFCETGLVITPVLPGDSMIFAAAALSAHKNIELNVHVLAALMILAAFSGDVVNYRIGRYIGPKVYKKNYRLISKNRLNRTKAFFKKYGTHTIVYARFIPVIRTFAPFVAGISEMKYSRFLLYNFTGGFCWVAIYAYGGYFLGNIPFVQQHFRLTVLALFLITLIPAVYAVLKVRIWKKGHKKHRL